MDATSSGFPNLRSGIFSKRLFSFTGSFRRLLLMGVSIAGGDVRAVADRHGCAFLDEALGDSQADALVATGDGRYSTFQEFWHGSRLHSAGTFPKENAQR
jgi:hypothetical protein